jgi:hypothetical protein
MPLIHVQGIIRDSGSFGKIIFFDKFEVGIAGERSCEGSESITGNLQHDTVDRWDDLFDVGSLLTENVIKNNIRNPSSWLEKQFVGDVRRSIHRWLGGGRKAEQGEDCADTQKATEVTEAMRKVM